MRKRSVPSPGKPSLNFPAMAGLAPYLPAAATTPSTVGPTPSSAPPNVSVAWPAIVVKQEHGSAAATLAADAEPPAKRPRPPPPAGPPAPPSGKARRLGDSEVESLGSFGSASRPADRLRTPTSDRSVARSPPPPHRSPPPPPTFSRLSW